MIFPQRMEFKPKCNESTTHKKTLFQQPTIRYSCRMWPQILQMQLKKITIFFRLFDHFIFNKQEKILFKEKTSFQRKNFFSNQRWDDARRQTDQLSNNGLGRIGTQQRRRRRRIHKTVQINQKKISKQFDFAQNFSARLCMLFRGNLSFSRNP